MVIKGKKFEREINDYALRLLEGTITIDDLLDYFENNIDAYKWFNKYACKYLYTTLKEIKPLRADLNNFHIRMYVYQLFQGYLFAHKIKFEIKAAELSFYYDMEKQCPEWFQSDYYVLSEIFPNLNDLVRDNMLYESILRICEKVNEYPVWLQSPEWIVENGVPLCFVEQTFNPDDKEYYGEEIVYTFKNKKGELKYVTQYF